MYKHITRLSRTSLLVHSFRQDLVRITCPVEVICIKPTDQIQLQQRCTVDEILPDGNHRLIYKINGGWFPYHHFIITDSRLW